MMQVVVSDIDGTLDLGDGLCHHVVRDELIDRQQDYPLIFLTFRDDMRRHETLTWLTLQGLEVYRLMMHNEDYDEWAFTQPWRYKAWALDKLMAEGYEIMAYYEDDRPSAEQAVERGITAVLVS